MFDDLLQGNARYAKNFPYRGLPGAPAHGLLIVTCMDSRLDPLEIFGLKVGQAKVLRTPGGFLKPSTLAGAISAVHKLNVDRIMVLEHTNCTMASADEAGLRAIIAKHAGQPVGDLVFGADPNQDQHLRDDVETLRNHTLIKGFAEVGGFMYDVETGQVTQVC